MARPAISCDELTPDVTLCVCHPDCESRSKDPNWWLYDKRAKMNIAMRAETREKALIEAMEYWATRCLKKETELKDLQSKVNQFVASVSKEEETWETWDGN